MSSDYHSRTNYLYPIMGQSSHLRLSTPSYYLKPYNAPKTRIFKGQILLYQEDYSFQNNYGCCC